MARESSVEASDGTFRIVFGGKHLKDDRKLRDYGVQRGSTLLLLVGLMGGAPSVTIIEFARGWESWYEFQDRSQVANAALDVQAQWDKVGMSVKTVREACAGEGYDREEQELLRQAGGFALPMASVPIMVDGVSSYIAYVQGARCGNQPQKPPQNPPSHVPHTSAQG